MDACLTVEHQKLHSWKRSCSKSGDRRTFAQSCMGKKFPPAERYCSVICVDDKSHQLLSSMRGTVFYKTLSSALLQIGEKAQNALAAHSSLLVTRSSTAVQVSTRDAILGQGYNKAYGQLAIFAGKSSDARHTRLFIRRSLASKAKAVSLQPRFSKQEPWKDLNKKKTRRGPDTSENLSKWTLPVQSKGMEDSYDFYESVFGSYTPSGLKMSSFDTLNVSQPSEEDLAAATAMLPGNDIFSVAEPTSKARLEGTRLKEFLEEKLINGSETEVILPEEFKTLTHPIISATVKELGLHWMVYGGKKSEIRIVSRLPLARYRAEFDPRTKTRHKINIDRDILGVVQLTLKTIQLNKYENDWVESPDDLKNDNEGTDQTNSLETGALQLPEKECTDEIESSDDEREGLSSLENEYTKYRPNPLHPLGDDDQRSLQLRRELFLSTESGKKMMETRQSLPAWKQKAELLDLIRDNPVVIVSGDTGCGKTTQLPQFILEDAIANGTISQTSIICTQPRRISAMSVSQRVADERGEDLGNMVGYQIRMANRRSPYTRLLFCTSGVLLRRLVSDPELSGVTHVIVDEIHERGMYEDFLLIILRKLLAKRSDLRLVLMSATIDPQAFSEYFSNAPVTHIPGFMHSVQEFFLEDILDKTGYQISSVDRGRDRKLQWYQKSKSLTENPAMLHYIPKKADFVGYRESTFASIRTWATCSNEKLHYGLIEATIEYICSHEDPGGVLVFLTSWEDILTMTELLESNPVVGNSSAVKLLPLHSTLASVSQEDIFKTPPAGIRKVVLATNIAETSITINDIVYVVNSGKAKQKSYDALNKIACLFPQWISKAGCIQRKGRAGRVQPGRVYHLFPRGMYDQCFIKHELPEIMRTPLADLCLQIKSLGVGSMQEFMSGAMNPPSPQTIQNAILQLKAIGAIDSQQDLTPLGRHLAHIPVEPTLGKMILMGAIFGCLDPCLILAAASTVKEPFQRPIALRKEADAIKLNLAAGTCSDHIALLRAFEGYRESRNYSRDARINYCRDNFLSAHSFDQMDRMRLHFAELLANIGFLNMERSRSGGWHLSPSGRYNLQSLEEAVYEHSKNSSNLELLRGVLCSGMFPSIAAVNNETKRPTFLTLEDGSVRPHLISVNNTAKFFPHRWLIYTDKVQTAGILFRNSTMVTDLALLLFGGELEPDKNQPGYFSMLNGRLFFQAEDDIMRMIVSLRSELQALLEKKIREPKIDIFEHGGSIVGAVLTLLSNERAPNKRKAQSLYTEALEGKDTKEEAS